MGIRDVPPIAPGPGGGIRDFGDVPPVQEAQDIVNEITRLTSLHADYLSAQDPVEKRRVLDEMVAIFPKLETNLDKLDGLWNRLSHHAQVQVDHLLDLTEQLRNGYPEETQWGSLLEKSAHSADSLLQELSNP
jgi:hypothetical protein